jgi:hypothetical protein
LFHDLQDSDPVNLFQHPVNPVKFSLRLRGLLLCFVFLLHLAAFAVGIVVLRVVFLHRTRTTVATTRPHRATSFAFLLVALSGGLRDRCRCKHSQQQRKKQYQDSVLSGFHFSSPVFKDYLPRTGEHTGTLLEEQAIST